MDYNVNFGFWGSIFAVPTDIVDNHLKMCSESQLKVLLLALRDAPNTIDVQYIAKRLGLSPSDVMDALEYWDNVGIFTPNTTSAPRESETQKTQTVANPVAKPANTAVTTQAQGVGNQKITTVHSRSKLTPSQITEMSLKDERIPWLLEELQQRLARPLSPAESETIIYLYSYLQLDPAYLLMAVEYCKCKGKTNMRYIERLITDWFDSGIDTLEKAEMYIVELDRRASNENLVKTMFGIRDRELSTKERNYINCWFSDLGMDAALIELAYERTIDSTGNLAFPYINKILTGWHSDGITNVTQAVNAQQSRKKQHIQQQEASFDISDIERVMRQNVNT